MYVKNVLGDCLHLVHKFDLCPYLIHLIKNNSANNAPYHNLYHTMNALINAGRIIFNDFPDINYSGNRAILAAVLFHDFNHSMGELTDNENINIALKNVEQKMNGKEDEDFINYVKGLISCTRFPYNKDDLLSDPMKIIRDADMSQIATENYFQQNVLGLSQELKIPLDKFISNQISFLSQVEFHTNFAKKHFQPVVIKHRETLIRLCTLMEIF